MDGTSLWLKMNIRSQTAAAWNSDGFRMGGCEHVTKRRGHCAHAEHLITRRGLCRSWSPQLPVPHQLTNQQDFTLWSPIDLGRGASRPEDSARQPSHQGTMPSSSLVTAGGADARPWRRTTTGASEQTRSSRPHLCPSAGVELSYLGGAVPHQIVERLTWADVLEERRRIVRDVHRSTHARP